MIVLHVPSFPAQNVEVVVDDSSIVHFFHSPSLIVVFTVPVTPVDSDVSPLYQ